MPEVIIPDPPPADAPPEGEVQTSAPVPQEQGPACTVCGTRLKGNRCDVCGKQLVDDP